MEREDKVRARAHAIWESEGQPSGRDQEHWEQAAQEIERQDALSMDDVAPSADAAPSDAGSSTDAAIVNTAPVAKKAPARRTLKAKQPTQSDARATKRGQGKAKT